MGQQSGISGYQTNYTVNTALMGKPDSGSPWGPQNQSPLRKFKDFKYSDKLGMLFEVENCWTFYPSVPLKAGEPLEFVHNGQTNILMLSGTVKSFKENPDTLLPIHLNTLDLNP
jgi:hypothetical protein